MSNQERLRELAALVGEWQRARKAYDEATEAPEMPRNYASITVRFERADKALMAVDVQENG